MLQTTRAGNGFGQVLSVGRRAIAAAGNVDCRCSCSLRDVPTMQEDAGLDYPESEKHEKRPENRPLHAFAEAALIAGHDGHWSDLGELGADIDRDQRDHDSGHCDGTGEQNGIFRRLAEAAFIA